MLYNRNWDKPKSKSKPKFWSIAGLEAWLSKQDPDVAYEYCDVRDCLLARYAKSRWGVRGVIAGRYKISYFHWGIPRDIKIPPGMDQIAYGSAWDRDRTYGAALDRARSYAR